MGIYGSFHKLGGMPVELRENRCKKSVSFKLHQRYQPALSFQDSTLSLLLGYISCIHVHIPCCCRIFLDENLRFILRLWNRMEHLKLRCFGSGSPLLMDLVLITYFYTTRRFKLGDPTVYLVGEKDHISRNTLKGRLQHDPQIPTSKRLPTFIRWKTVPLKGCSGQDEKNRLSWVFVPPVVLQYYWCASKMDQEDWQLKVGTPTESIWKWCQYSGVPYLLYTKKSHQQPLLSISKERNPNFCLTRISW